MSHYMSIRIRREVFALCRAIFFGIACLSSLSGCDRIPLIKKFGFHIRLLEQAEQAEADGKYLRALDLYEQCLTGTQGPEIHYRMALIYDSKLQNPIAALYHFQRFLEKMPDDPRAKAVNKDVKRLRLLVASQLSDGVVVSRADAIRLKNENLQLQTQLTLLRSQKEGLRSSSSKSRTAQGFSTNPVTHAAEKLVGPETRTYKVEKGDTLASISRKFYKTPQRWKDIADANQNQLEGTTHLKVGMTLIIP
jgi:LysM repeat protein